MFLMAEGHSLESPSDIELPALDLSIVLWRTSEIRGRLVIPDGWPEPRRFGASAVSEDRLSGVAIGEDGSFTAELSARLDEFQVNDPRVGSCVYRVEDAFTEGADVELGEIHLARHVARYAFVVTDEEGEPIANEFLKVSTEDQSPVRVLLKTD